MFPVPPFIGAYTNIAVILQLNSTVTTPENIVYRLKIGQKFSTPFFYGKALEYGVLKVIVENDA